MRALIVLTLACLTAFSAAEARPLRIRVHGGQVAAILLHECILTRHQLACAKIVRGHLGSRRVEQVAVFERHGGPCPGTAAPPSYLFDVYVDRVSGTVDYTPESNEELQTILPLPH